MEKYFDDIRKSNTDIDKKTKLLNAKKKAFENEYKIKSDELNKHINMLETKKKQLKKMETDMIKKTQDLEKNEIKSYIKIKQYEEEMLKNIENSNIETELINTGRIKCGSHIHKHVKTFRKCIDNNSIVSNPNIKPLYFTNLDDINFYRKIDELFELFPDTMRKSINIHTRFTKYKSYHKKILVIYNIIIRKKKKYERMISKLEKQIATCDNEHDNRAINNRQLNTSTENSTTESDTSD
jgi:hypothetical protein